MPLSTLNKYLPPNALPYITEWLGTHKIDIHIKRGRKSKLGDYCKQANGRHMISINHSLPPELFFFVFTHELAHLLVREQYKQRVAPHGMEWKRTFGLMILESLSVYNDNLKPILIRFAKNPKASFYSSEELVRYFRMEENITYIEHLLPNDIFLYRGVLYRFLGKMRTRYRCLNLETKMEYRFSPLVEVDKVDE